MTVRRWMVLVAVFAASLTGLAGYHRWVTAALAAHVDRARSDAGLPPGTDMNDWDIPMSGSLMLHMDLDHAIERFWFLIIPVVLLVSFGLAMLVPAPTKKSVASASGGSNHERTGNGDS